MDGDYAYIGQEVSQPLIDAVSEVCDVRPEDPITYIAESLKKFSRENSKTSQELADTESKEQAQVSFVHSVYKWLFQHLTNDVKFF